MPMRCLAALIPVLLLLCACGAETPPGPNDSGSDAPTSKAGRYEFVKGSTLDIKVGVEGAVEIRVTMPEGSPGAGTYTSRDPDLQEDATFAQNRLNEEGATVAIEVDDAGEIVAFSTTARIR